MRVLPNNHLLGWLGAAVIPVVAGNLVDGETQVSIDLERPFEAADIRDFWLAFGKSTLSPMHLNSVA
jgi:hypothetical protein